MIDLTRLPSATSSNPVLTDHEVRAAAAESLSRLLAEKLGASLLAAAERAVASLDPENERRAQVRDTLRAEMEQLIEEFRVLVLQAALQPPPTTPR